MTYLSQFLLGYSYKITQKHIQIAFKLLDNSLDKTMADKLMFIPNNDTQNYPFCSAKLVVETFEHST